ncbi:MAG: hypothetical protein JW807_00905 [Spirochaetes bacterium]|nr:hypothetical protein [Spirochaetota bacterium]
MNNAEFYDPQEVRIIVNGFDLTGFTDGDKIKIEPVTKEAFKSHAGVDGDTSFSKVHDNRHAITVNLKHGSPSNALLDGLLKSGANVAVSIMNNSEGKYIGGGSYGRISERPGVTFGGETGKREWKIIVADYIGTDMAS